MFREFATVWNVEIGDKYWHMATTASENSLKRAMDSLNENQRKFIQEVDKSHQFALHCPMSLKGRVTQAAAEVGG